MCIVNAKINNLWMKLYLNTCKLSILLSLLEQLNCVLNDTWYMDIYMCVLSIIYVGKIMIIWSILKPWKTVRVYSWVSKKEIWNDGHCKVKTKRCNLLVSDYIYKSYNYIYILYPCLFPTFSLCTVYHYESYNVFCVRDISS